MKLEELKKKYSGGSTRRKQQMERLIDENDIIHRFTGLMTDGREVYVPLSEVIKAIQQAPTIEVIGKGKQQ
jgi:hypothetical protein